MMRVSSIIVCVMTWSFCVNHAKAKCPGVTFSCKKHWLEASRKWQITCTVTGDGTSGGDNLLILWELAGLPIGNGAGNFKSPADAKTREFEVIVPCDENAEKLHFTLGVHGDSDNLECASSVVDIACPQPGAITDPHFITFSGEKYDFHGECDLVLLQNPGYNVGMGMNIHLRTKIEKFYSYIKTAVVQIGDETFEVTGAPENNHWLNGLEGAKLPTRISGHPIGHREIDENHHKYKIFLGDNGGVIEISTYKHFVSVSIKSPSKENFQGSLGLMGAHETGSKVARDGLTLINDPNEFGFEWQVLPSDPKILLVSESPQYPERCYLPTISAYESRNLRSEGDAISLEHARRACARVATSDFDICVFDVLATNDVGIAGAY